MDAPPPMRRELLGNGGAIAKMKKKKAEKKALKYAQKKMPSITMKDIREVSKSMSMDKKKQEGKGVGSSKMKGWSITSKPKPMLQSLELLLDDDEIHEKLRAKYAKLLNKVYGEFAELAEKDKITTQRQVDDYIRKVNVIKDGLDGEILIEINRAMKTSTRPVIGFRDKKSDLKNSVNLTKDINRLLEFLDDAKRQIRPESPLSRRKRVAEEKKKKSEEHEKIVRSATESLTRSISPASSLGLYLSPSASPANSPDKEKLRKFSDDLGDKDKMVKPIPQKGTGMNNKTFWRVPPFN